MMNILCKAGCSALILLAVSASARASIITAVVRSSADSPRAVSVRDSAGLALERFTSFAPSIVFVNQELINDQMKKYSCGDESCLLSFARDAKIDCLIFVTASEGPEGIRIGFTARVPGVPYGGKAVKSYSALLSKSGIAREALTAATEEHAGKFIALLLRSIRLPVPVSVNGGKLTLGEELSGKYEVFRKIPGSPLFYETQGFDDFTKGVSAGSSYNQADAYFVLRDFAREGASFDEYLYGRKHEMLFSGSEGMTQYKVLFYVPALSAVSPIALPLGYYRNADYPGLFFSGCAMTPWGIVTAKYLKNAYWDKDTHLTQKEKGSRNFGLYWIFAGNSSLVVDMYAHEALDAAANYRPTEYLGGNATAVGLSILTPGGGMFYRGERLYGHLYYQAGNFLMYKTLLSFSSGERFNSDTGRYEKVKADRKKASAWLAGLIVLKGGEILHTVLTRDAVEAKHTVAQIEFQPLLEYDDGLRAGAGLVFRW